MQWAEGDPLHLFDIELDHIPDGLPAYCAVSPGAVSFFFVL